MTGLVDGALRVVLTAAHHLLQLRRLLRQPKTYGAHAVALTPEGKIVLVKLRYAPGWRIPGGGRRENEPPMHAALRELREEIGMFEHGEALLAEEFEVAIRFKSDTASLVVVRDVRYRPRWSWEIERVMEANLHGLPSDLSPLSRRWIESLSPLLQQLR